MKWLFTSTSPASTELIAEQIGSQLTGGEVIELISDLGGGKTTFVHGLARGLGSTDTVASPSFTISREYKTANLTLYHFDFYRLAQAGIVEAEISEVVNDQASIVVVEWAKIIEKVLPTERLIVNFKVIDENSREICLIYPKKLAYLIPKVAKV